MDEFVRMVMKQDEGPATTPPSADHRDGGWIGTDCYVGEWYMDILTDQLYVIGYSGAIIPIPMTPGTDTNFSNQNLVFDANREHDTDGYTLTITTDAGAGAQSTFEMASTYTYVGFDDNYVSIDSTGFNYTTGVTTHVLDSAGFTTGGAVYATEIGISMEYTLPLTDGSAGQFMQTDGAGNISFATVSAGLTVGTTAITSGTSGRLLFEGSGNVLQEDAGLLFNATAKTLTNYGKGATSTNTSFGLGVFENGSGAGANNTAFGWGAGNYLTSGASNTFIGYRAGGGVLAANFTGSGNVCVGYGSGLYLSSGIQNTFIGNNTGTSITTGNYNTIIGHNGTSYSSSLQAHIIITDGAAAQGFKKDGNHNIVLSQESALATNATNGFLYIRACAGTPTGVPATAFTGHVPVCIDSTNNKMYIYSGGAWVALN